MIVEKDTLVLNEMKIPTIFDTFFSDQYHNSIFISDLNTPCLFLTQRLSLTKWIEFFLNINSF